MQQKRLLNEAVANVRGTVGTMQATGCLVVIMETPRLCTINHASSELANYIACELIMQFSLASL